MRVTLQDVADSLKLSRSAVCRGLRDDPSIPPATRKRIRSACVQLGYRSDALLSELAATRWRRDKVSGGSTFAYINCLPTGASVWDLSGPIRKQAAFLGYGVEILERTAFGSSSQLQRTLRNRGITEVLIGPVHHENLSVQLDWDKFICVQLLPDFYPLPLHSVVRDHFNGVALAWRKAVSYGYRRIGVTLLKHPSPIFDDVMRMSGVHACQKHLFPELPALPPFLFSPEDHRVPEFVQWIKRHRPDVIIGFNDVHFHRFRAAFGHDLPYASLHAGAEMSGIPEYTERCAVEAVNLLQFCRRTYQWGLPEQRIDHVLEPKWFEGTTMPRKSGGAPSLS